MTDEISRIEEAYRVLKAAKPYIEHQWEQGQSYGWIKGAYTGNDSSVCAIGALSAAMNNGNPMMVHYSAIEAGCAAGFLAREMAELTPYGQSAFPDVEEAASSHEKVGVGFGTEVPNMNDDRLTTHSMVVEAFDRAIEKAAKTLEALKRQKGESES